MFPVRMTGGAQKWREISTQIRLISEKRIRATLNQLRPRLVHNSLFTFSWFYLTHQYFVQGAIEICLTSKKLSLFQSSVTLLSWLRTSSVNLRQSQSETWGDKETSLETRLCWTGPGAQHSRKTARHAREKNPDTRDINTYREYRLVSYQVGTQWRKVATVGLLTMWQTYMQTNKHPKNTAFDTWGETWTLFHLLKNL